MASQIVHRLPVSEKLGKATLYLVDTPFIILSCLPEALQALSEEALYRVEGQRVDGCFDAAQRAQKLQSGRKNPGGVEEFRFPVRNRGRKVRQLEYDPDCRAALWRAPGEVLWFNLFARTDLRHDLLGEVWTSVDGELAFDPFEMGVLTIDREINPGEVAKARDISPEAAEPFVPTATQWQQLRHHQIALAHKLVPGHACVN